jgi:adenylate cyclase
MRTTEGSSGRTVLHRLAAVASLDTDTHEEALRKRILVLAATTITALSVVWVVTYWILGLHLAAAIPFAYQLVSIVNLVILAKTGRYRFFRACELGLSLILPFLLQLSLGGFVASSGVVLWSFTAPLGALLFSTRRAASRWFVAFLVVVVAAGILDAARGDAGPDIPSAIVIVFFVMNVVGVTGTSYFLMHYFVRERDEMAAIVEDERARSERLLLNVLPAEIAERLKAGESVIADRASRVGVLFADIAGFTPLSETMPPEDVVRLLNEVFSIFDGLTEEHGLEKIKTIGDAYMVASGLLGSRPSHAEDLARMALAMQREMARFPHLELRIGIDIGPVVAGVIGRSKFIYDLWGDTVNTASRMESHGLPNAIQVTERAHEELAAGFEFDERGTIDVKGKGTLRTFLLKCAKEPSRGV